MASLGALANEVFDSIIGYIMADGCCEGTLAALAATCRGFYNLSMPHLYQEDVAERHPALLYWAAYFGCIGTAKRLIDAGARVDRHMQWNSERDFNTVCGSKTPGEAYRDLQTRVAKNRIIFIRKKKLQRSVWYPIHLAAMGGCLETVKLLAKTWPEGMNAWCFKLCRCLAVNPPGPAEITDTPQYCLPIHIAACHHQHRVVRWLLEQGCAPVSALKPSDGGQAPKKYPRLCTTALHDAARFGHEDMVEFILDNYHTDVNVLDGRQLSPIWYACLHRHFAVVDLLVARGADIDDDIGDGHTPLIDACFRNDFSAACHLIDRGANVNVEFHPTSPKISKDMDYAYFTGRGVRPIDICCWVQCKAFPVGSPLLLSADEVSQTWQPLRSDEDNGWRDYEGTRDQRLAVVSRLLGAGANLEPPSGGNPPPLVVAAANHLLGVVREMIKHGASVNVADCNGVTPLAAAFAYLDSYCPFHPQIGKWVANEKPFLATGNTWRECTRDDIDPDQAGCPELRAIVELLLENGAQVDQADARGNTPLRRLFTAFTFRPYLGLRAALSIWITSADRTRIGPWLLQRGANAKDGTMGPMQHWAKGAKQIAGKKLPADRWPRSALEHAFWDADYEACKHLVEAGLVPDQRTVLWMLRIVLESGLTRHEGGTLVALEFLDSLPTKWRDMRGGSASCLTIALRRKWLDLAQDLWAMGPELGEFSAEKLLVGYWIPVAPAASSDEIEIGQHCLHAATIQGATSILDGLLELGVRPIPSCALLFAVSDNRHGILKTLVKYGGPVHIKDRHTDGGVVGYVNCPTWVHLEGCINPLRLAIKQRKYDAIRIMLSESPTPIEPWFRHYYLREAYTFLDPSAVACLLEHPDMRLVQADAPHGANDDYCQSVDTDSPLARLVEYVEVICSTGRLGYGSVEFDGRACVKKVRKWMQCVAAFAQAGVDPTLRTRRGPSALQYLGQHLAYKGPEQLLRHVRSELRAVAGLEREDVGIVEDGEREVEVEIDLDAAAACYEALKSLKIGS